MKPLLRGHFHQAAFFIAIGACAVLISDAHGSTQVWATLIYSLSLINLLGTSALYHRPQWDVAPRALMRKLDHAAIFILIAGTCTPICLIGIPETGGATLLKVVWIAALFGVLQSIFWAKAPKFLAAIFYVGMGWLAFPYVPEIRQALGGTQLAFMLIGGGIYTAGAVVYATKKPNPSPKYFGYHEIFHLMVVIAAGFHFVVISSLL